MKKLIIFLLSIGSLSAFSMDIKSSINVVAINGGDGSISSPYILEDISGQESELICSSLSEIRVKSNHFSINEFKSLSVKFSDFQECSGLISKIKRVRLSKESPVVIRINITTSTVSEVEIPLSQL
jgi:hypothetical protein